MGIRETRKEGGIQGERENVRKGGKVIHYLKISLLKRQAQTSSYAQMHELPGPLKTLTL